MELREEIYQETIILPTFPKTDCIEYFKKTFSVINPRKLFRVPDHIPKFDQPSIEFDLKKPTYQEVTRIIRRMKTSGSPCPLDQISIICLQRMPCLRTYIHRILVEAWKAGSVPSTWKRAVTVLIHKKGDPNVPANFRPITLESVPLKVFTSLIRNRMFDFLLKNKYLEHNIQKGFIPKISGTYDHTAQMAFLINQARLKQRSLFITLLDLRNAFGEVHHNLIQETLRFHHVPIVIQNLIKDLYTDFKTSAITTGYATPFIPVTKGVLQGDCLSPLTFNMIFNISIQLIRKEDYSQLGYKHDAFLRPRNWLQFADDACVVTGQEYENQILLNCFTAFCSWANMEARPDKCKAFGMMKVNTNCSQVSPKVFVSNLRIPPVLSTDSFTYLGRSFNFKMDNEEHKKKLLETTNLLLEAISKLPLHPKNKILLYSTYFMSKVSWDLTIADLDITWVKQNLDSLAHRYIRLWLEIPISGTLDIISLTKEKCGLGIIDPSTKFSQCQVSLRKCLKKSPNGDIQSLHKVTSRDKNVQYDTYANGKEVIKENRMKKVHRITHELSSQGLILKAILEHTTNKITSIWSEAQKLLPKNIFNFSVRYLNNSLPTKKNMKFWGRVESELCNFCQLPQSLLHVVSGCKSMLEGKRYTWRHNSVLLTIGNFLTGIRNVKVYADDIPGFRPSAVITGKKQASRSPCDQ